MGDIKDISGEDVDMLTEDVQNHFKTPYTLKEFKSVGLDDTYVLHLSTNSDCILAGLSNNSVVAYGNPNLNKVLIAMCLTKTKLNLPYPNLTKLLIAKCL